MSSEIAIQFQKGESQNSPQQTPTKYQLNLSDEEFQRIESLENESRKKHKNIKFYKIFIDVKKNKENNRRKAFNLKLIILPLNNLCFITFRKNNTYSIRYYCFKKSK